jgi:hypothetical protein
MGEANQVGRGRQVGSGAEPQGVPSGGESGEIPVRHPAPGEIE